MLDFFCRSIDPLGKFSPPLPPKKVMICEPVPSFQLRYPQPSTIHTHSLTHTHPLQHTTLPLSFHPPSRIIEELNKTLVFTMQRLERWGFLYYYYYSVVHATLPLVYTFMCQSTLTVLLHGVQFCTAGCTVSADGERGGEGEQRPTPAPDQRPQFQHTPRQHAHTQHTHVHPTNAWRRRRRGGGRWWWHLIYKYVATFCQAGIQV